jgi:hypothetical protein
VGEEAEAEEEVAVVVVVVGAGVAAGPAEGVEVEAGVARSNTDGSALACGAPAPEMGTGELPPRKPPARGEASSSLKTLPPSPDASTSPKPKDQVMVGDAVLDPRQPEGLVYKRRGQNLHLVALRVNRLQDCLGRRGADRATSALRPRFDLVDSPKRYELDPFYALHAWAWKVNPRGDFFAWNPRVDC